jgi:P27 family predicted phage terminase small subunit
MLAVVTTDDTLPVPTPPPGLLAPSVALWESFWMSRIATAVDTRSDMPGLLRWITAYDEWLRATRALRRVRIVRGSMGQPVLSPLAGYLSQRAAELRDLEAAYGMTPKARLNLGLTVGQIELTAAKLNEMVRDDPPSADVDEDLEGEFESA